MSDKPEYLKDGVWYGKRPPGQFVGQVRHGKKEWVKADPTPEGRDHKGRIVGHVCCLCPACAAYEANYCPNRGPIDRLFP